MPPAPEQSALRQLPSVHELVARAQLIAPEMFAVEGRARATEALRAMLDSARDDILAHRIAAAPSEDALVRGASDNLRDAAQRQSPVVVNATGVIIHTNLGRATLSNAARQAMLAVAGDYTPLEFDLASGERGRRGQSVEDLLCELSGAEAALVVNNNAAATSLMLTALARGKGVVIARGQLVEIGGGFRVPDILAQSGARLVEVGTTNKVRASDYARAIAEPSNAVGAILRVHASNFKMIGFVEDVPIADLVALGRTDLADARILALDDIGSGALVDTSQFGLSKEPMPQDSVRAGVDVVCFSGDKLLGGPQAGILVGKRDAIEMCRRHPLARAFRADKFTLAALGATLLHYARDEALREVPVLRMMAMSPFEIEARAKRIVTMLNDARLSVADARSTVGGGSLPGDTLPTRVIAVRTDKPNDFAAALRRAPTPVVARVNDDAVLLDLRTVLDDDALLASLSRTLKTP